MARPTEKTIKRHFAVSGNRCAFPDCTATLVTGTTVTAEICHIVGGNNPVDPHQAVHAHLRICEVCQDAYNAQLVQIRGENA